MNILHMKYAVEVAKVGSLNKAAEVTLPNISRSIKELEADLGITVFDRTAKGMVLTPEGEEFISYAKDMEALAKYIKETSEGAKVVFIGPCTAKKADA